LLEILARNRGRLVTQKQLLRDVWGPAYGSESNYLRVYVAQLRRKLEQEPSRPRHLLTEPGMGYRFQPSPSSPASGGAGASFGAGPREQIPPGLSRPDRGSAHDHGVLAAYLLSKHRESE